MFKRAGAASEEGGMPSENEAEMLFAPYLQRFKNYL